MTNKRMQLTFEGIRTRGKLRLKAYLVRWKNENRNARWLANFRRENGRQPNVEEMLNWMWGKYD